MSNCWASSGQASAPRSACKSLSRPTQPRLYVLALLVALTLFCTSAQFAPAQRIASLSSVAPRALAAYGLVSSGDFSLSLTPNMIAATAKETGTGVVTITPVDGFSAPVALACSGLPQGAACTFSPATVTPSGGPATSNLAISYARPTSAQHRPATPLAPLGALACALLFFGMRKHRNFFLALAGLCLLGLGVGCGTANSSLQTYTVTLSATYGTLDHSTNFLLTVE
jgi:hypothetical protein